MDFQARYPLSAKSAVHTPVVFRAGIPGLADLPWPTLDGIRDFALFAGISESAMRTAISRAKAAGSLTARKDASGVTRYRLPESTFQMGLSVIGDSRKKEGFLVAVFSFSKDDVAERSIVRETLRDFGFRKLAQNTYINGMIDTTALRAAMRGFGLEKHLYLFPCSDIEDPDLIQKILELFDVEGRAKELQEFWDLLTAYLSVKGLSSEEIARRLLYAGPVQYELCSVNEPPFPAKHLPPDYPLGKIRSFMDDFSAVHGKELMEYYRKTNL